MRAGRSCGMYACPSPSSPSRTSSNIQIPIRLCDGRGDETSAPNTSRYSWNIWAITSLCVFVTAANADPHWSSKSSSLSASAACVSAASSSKSSSFWAASARSFVRTSTSCITVFSASSSSFTLAGVWRQLAPPLVMLSCKASSIDSCTSSSGSSTTTLIRRSKMRLVRPATKVTSHRPFCMLAIAALTSSGMRAAAAVRTSS
mmetsp:Transcript_68580/g.143026  ORF Transcript_68580/g.143026 Transcript_68580/m.143026 type:complete len:203 (-) Transcript_68580:2235-2843(-)